MQRISWGTLYWAVLASGLVVSLISLAANNVMLYVLILFVIVVSCILAFNLSLKAPLVKPFQRFRERVVVAWAVGLALTIFGFLIWGISARAFPGEYSWFWLLLWLMAILFTAGLTAAEARVLGQRLGSRKAVGWIVALTTLVLTIFAVEVLMRLTIDISDSFAVSPMHQDWMERYWKPINELGYRDVQLPDTDDPVQRIIVVGDSFAAGQGLRNITDRFDRRLASALDNRYAVNIVARPGWETDAQLVALREYPQQPDIVILAYNLNDIAYVNPEVLSLFRETFPESAGIVGFMANHFYTAGFLYYHLYWQYVRQGLEVYTGIILRPYEDAELWAQHRENLDAFRRHTEEQDAKLIVLLWPTLTNIEMSTAPLAMVERYFADHGLPVINMVDHLQNVPVVDMVVNPFDAHPSSYIHGIAAEILATMFED